MSAQAYQFPEERHYIRFSLSPATTDELRIRKAISTALAQSFGITAESTYVDVLWVSGDGKECVLRVHQSDATKVITSLVSSSDTPRLALVKESPFLPSLIVSSEPL
ncbi:hypothetical protein BDQ17DRAFT_1246205 [Cyathus striatus]|nr:hypothetical protein BDQ17DRAFT_1246205 [Cyathus striatus]